MLASQAYVEMLLLIQPYIVECPVLTDPDNGEVDCSFEDDEEPTEGDTCTYQCDDGYMLNGDMTRVCQADETWSGSDPTCDLSEKYV